MTTLSLSQYLHFTPFHNLFFGLSHTASSV